MTSKQAYNSQSAEKESVELIDNGLIIRDVYLPIEIIQRIMCYADEKTLLNCQLVCKCWNEIIMYYVWRKKAEMKTGHKFPSKTVLDWKDFYLICAKNLFEQNFVKNHSGADGFKYWLSFTDHFQDNRGYLPELDIDEDFDLSDNSDGNSDIEMDNDNDNGDENVNGNESDSDSEHLNIIDLNRENENHRERSSESDSDDDSESEEDDGPLPMHGSFSESYSDNGSDSESEEAVIADDNDFDSDNNDNMGYLGGWIVECPPCGAPALPLEPEFEDKEHCFVTTYYDCYKEQIIDLFEVGFSANILDHMQPPIEINEWYCCRVDCPAYYNIRVRLLNELDETIDEFVFKDTLEGDRQNVWLNVKHEFKNYGQGLRKIRFVHGGRDRRHWAGHYGSKMAGAYVRVKVPDGF